MSARVPVAISMGDPAGIGPEVALKAIASPGIRRTVDAILVGDAGVWRATARRLGLPLHPVYGGGPVRRGSTRCVVTSELPASARRPGPPARRRDAARCGDAAYRAILAAVGLVRDGAAAALVTAPISKAHLAAAGHDFPGHTELLAHLCGDVPVRMLMVGSRLRVVLVTTHLPLAAVSRRLTRDMVLQTITLTAHALRIWFGMSSPRIAVTGLNPHAGEGGLFGTEDTRVILPAVGAARRRGVDATGPLAADGVFAHAAGGAYDAVVCMYHDQGLAPFKLLHFADGVNLTLGLPFVRTSPDHGTAFDIAGTGRADARSMIAALRLAATLAPQRKSPLVGAALAAVS